MKIAVVALGKIGLPLAVQFAERGHNVVGSDINDTVVAHVNRGEAPFPGEADLATKLAAVVKAGRLTATTNTIDAVAQADVVLVVVPLFVSGDGEPQFAWLDAATRDIAQGLTSNTLVLYETTLPVGTTRNRWKPTLEQGSGLVEGADFHVAFSPERVLTGRIFADLRKYPKLVGALSDEGAKLAIAFYEEVLEFDARPDLERANGVWDLGSAEAAEMTKLAETTYRDVNIGLANQFAKYAASQNVDIFQVIDAANSQPFSHIHRPGIAVGGHCIPVYPQLYLWNDPEASIVSAARSANTSMPQYCVELAQQAYGALDGARAVVLGAAYRGGVKETAFSGVYPTVTALLEAGAAVQVHDPLYDAIELEELGFEAYVMGTPIDLAIIHTNHDEYRQIRQADLPDVQVIVDGRNIINEAAFDGVKLVVLGKAALEWAGAQH